ncbi:MAG: penicillin-binding transpeptidase domain-containing protein, partial [Vicinamibacterales bacterium]|nr:penicillin-binding transpeptidase domain-containing protein [Vicinamibacterales bacterium]
GLIQVASRVIRDVHRYDLLSFTDVIVKSSNVGAIKVGTRLGNERLGRYVRRFGFGTRLCPDLPGETAGMLATPSSWSPSALASISMGYEIGVTPIQMAAAFSSVANGGSLIQPRVVHNLRTGTRQAVVEPHELRRTIEPATVAELVSIMEQVVERGTGKTATVPGFTVAGKTGTAAKVINGRYSKSDYHASFVGFVPSRRPALTILVVIDTPRGSGYPGKHRYYGGEIAAPVFRRVAEQALRYLGVAPTVNAVPPVLLAESPLVPSAGGVTPVAAMTGVPAVDIASGAPVVPDLRGLGAREAVRRLTRLGLTAHLSGDGVVLEQDPLPGTPVESRSACALRLGRVSPSPGGTAP